MPASDRRLSFLLDQPIVGNVNSIELKFHRGTSLLLLLTFVLCTVERLYSYEGQVQNLLGMYIYGEDFVLNWTPLRIPQVEFPRFSVSELNFQLLLRFLESWDCT